MKTKNKKYHEKRLNIGVFYTKKSGLLGVSGISSDSRDVEDAESFVRDTRSGGGQHFSEVNIPLTPEPANRIRTN